MTNYTSKRNLWFSGTLHYLFISFFFSALDVTCNDDGRVVARVARETLGPAINTLNLNDPSPAGCSVDVAADHFDDIEIEFTVAECGTEHAKVGDNIVSTNHITGVAQGGVVRTYDTDFTVECSYYAKDTLWNSFTPLHSVGDGDSGMCCGFLELRNR